jgi:hypothetical protein
MRTDPEATIHVSKYGTDEHAEPYLWYDDRDENNEGWVLRYSLGEDVGQVHLDEALDVCDWDDEQEAVYEARRFLRSTFGRR